MSKSKQVVNDVLSFKTPEYLPLGTYAIDCDTVEKVIGRKTFVRNKIAQQVAIWEGRRDEVLQSLVEDSVELFKKLECIDIVLPFKEGIYLPPRNYEKTKYKKVGDDIWELENGDVYKASWLSNELTLIKHLPYPEPKIEDYEGEPVITPPNPEIFEAIDGVIAGLKDIKHLCSDTFFRPMLLIGDMVDGLMLYSLEPELIEQAIGYTTKMHNALDEYYIRPGVDQIFVDQDYGTTTSSFISPRMFNRFVVPAMKSRVQSMKRYRDKVIMHSCGNTWKLIDTFIEAGIDCYQSLQTGAGMDMKLLKDQYGGKLTFWGGVAVENLIAGTPEDIRKDVRYAIEHGKRQGGIIVGPSHSVAYGVKYENFMAMVDEHDKLKYQVT